MIRVVKFYRSLPTDGRDFVRPSDGSTCLCTITKCSMNGKSTDVRLKLCDFCFTQNLSQCPEVALRGGFQFKLSLDQAPGLESCQKVDVTSIENGSIRQILGSCVSNSIAGEIFHLDLEVIGPEENSDSIQLEVRVDKVISPPQCDRKVSSIESEIKDARDVTTNDWNPDLQQHWLNRALKLKERGSQIIRFHPSDIKGRNIDLQKWSTAFGFYSRAFQLISLANLANETCNTTDNYGISSFNELTQKTGDNYFDLDQILPNEDSLNSEEVKPKQLEFNLLLNLALCQLKAGTADFCAQNCSQALTLDPGWIDLNSPTDIDSLTNRANELGIGYADICKALFRRSQAYFNVGKLDEAQSDLEQSLRILKYHQVDSSNATFSATESLLGRVRDRISREQAILASRLRNRENLFS